MIRPPALKRPRSGPFAVPGRLLLVELAAVVLGVGTLGAQTSLVDSLLRVARYDLSHGRVDSAEAIYERLLDQDEKLVPAMIGMGRVKLAREEWSDAGDDFDDALAVDPSNLEAHFYGGVANREAATNVALILRTLKWNAAEEHFTFVLARDSLYRDALYEYALLERYRGNLKEALDLAYLQIAKTPESPRARLGLFKIYRFILWDQSPAATYSLLQYRPTTVAVFFGGELLRRGKKLTEAEKIFTDLLRSPAEVPVQAMHLALAKLYVTRGEAQKAEEEYWRGVDHITSLLGADLIFEELKYIITDAELDEYSSIASDRKKQAFFRAFWARRNPTPSAPLNPRLQEHYRRLVAAEENFEYYGFRSPFNDPERFKTFRFPRSFALNKEYNDKGQIFLRHGQPNVTRRVISDSEVWVYYALGEDPQRIFSFSLRNSVGNNWRLISLPNDPELIQELATYDARYRDLLVSNQLARLGREDAIIQQSRVDVEEALVTDRHTWREETIALPVPGSVDAFRSEEKKTLLDVSYGIPLDEIAKHIPEGTKSVRIEVGIDVSTTGGISRASRVDTLDFSVDGGFRGTYVNLSRFRLAPDSVRIGMHVRPLGTPMIGGWQKSMRVPDFTSAALMMSDLQFLLPSTQATSIEIEGVKVIQSPFDRVSQGSPLYTYVHVYNLTKDFWGATLFTVKYLLSPWDAEPGEDETVLFEETVKGAEPFEARFRILDLKKADTGKQRLTVRVVDTKVGKTAESSRLLEIVD